MPAAGSTPLGYARHVAGLLHPPPATISVSRHEEGDEAAAWLLLPDPRRPTLMVPVGARGARVMLQRHGDRLAPRAARAVLGWSVGSGVLARLPYPRLTVTYPVGGAAGSASLAAWLGELEPRMTDIGVLLGTARANRKPVLQMFDASGATLAFVKLGDDVLTGALVRREAANLTRVAQVRLRTIRTPDVLHAGRHGALEVLMLSPMTSSQRRRDVRAPLTAMGELALAFGTHAAALADSAYWHRLRLRQRELPDSPPRDALRSAMDSVEDRWGTLPIGFGAWHGDWAPWNMGRVGDVVELWDWERLDTDVPLGFDVVHFRAQTVRHDAPGLAEAERRMRQDLPAMLDAALGGLSPRSVDCVLSVYSVEVALRYLEMTLSSVSGPVSHPRADWALALARRLAAAPR